LSNGKGFYHPLVYVLECHRLGITLLPPSINQPGPLFSPVGKSIRVPVRYIKGMTERTNERLWLNMTGRRLNRWRTFTGALLRRRRNGSDVARWAFR
jgi:DNA polymerase III alpha subunit